MEKTNEKEEFLTTKELAKALKIHPQSVERLLKEGLPVLYVRGTRRFLLSEVIIYLGEKYGRKPVE